MPNPIGYYFYLKSRAERPVPGLHPRPRAQSAPEDGWNSRQTLGLLLMAAVICVPVLATWMIALTLRLWS